MFRWRFFTLALAMALFVAGCDDDKSDGDTLEVDQGETLEDQVDQEAVSEDLSEDTEDGEDLSEETAEDLEDTEDGEDLNGDQDLEETVEPPLDLVDEHEEVVEDLVEVQDDVETDGLVGEALRDALQEQTVQNHIWLGYTGARDQMYAIGGVDDQNGRIECIYTGRTVDTNGSRTPGNNCTLKDGTPTNCQFNTEHSWAKYFLREHLGEGSDEYSFAEGDIHHLFPSYDTVNNYRWHFPFGPTECLSSNNCRVDEESQLGLVIGGTGSPSCPTGNLELDRDCAMQVRPERRGDIARGQFYMAVRYGMPMYPEDEEVLRAWNLADPPDQWERTRNDAIESVQGNRNPFVDDPSLVDLIDDY